MQEALLKVFPDGDQAKFSQRGKETFKEVATLLSPLPGKIHEILSLGQNVGLFQLGNGPCSGEDLRYIDFSFSDIGDKNFSSSNTSDDDNATLGIPPVYKQIVGPHQTIAINPKFFSFLQNRPSISPKQWTFFMLLGLGFIGYTRNHGTLNKILMDEDDRVRNIRTGIERLDDFALLSMGILGTDVSDLGNPFGYLKSDTMESSLYSPKDRGKRLQKAIELSFL